MGSKNEDPRQLDGMGGATSTTSKVAIVSPSSRPGIDVEYTFAQVAIGNSKVDYSGNCGNMASGVGPFALEEGIVQAKPGQKNVTFSSSFQLFHADVAQVDIHILNTNTGRILLETVAINEDGYYVEEGDYHIAGVKDTGSEIKVAFVDPAGAMTGTLFPTGNSEDTITVDSRNGLADSIIVQATLIDIANPFVIVDSTSLPSICAQGSTDWLNMVEDVRRQAAVTMGLADSIQEAATTRGTPKIMIVSPSSTATCLGSFRSAADISVLAMSMGQVHPSVQLTGAVCLGAAACLEGTVAYRCCNRSNVLPRHHTAGLTAKALSDQDFVLPVRRILIEHRSGQIPVEVHLQGQDLIEKCVVSRTARKLFEGSVLFYT